MPKAKSKEQQQAAGAALSAKRFGVLADSFPQHELAANSRLQQGLMLFNAEKFPEAQQALQKFIRGFQELLLSQHSLPG